MGCISYAFWRYPLLDTGATVSAVPNAVMESLNIRPYGEMPLSGVHGVKNSLVYYTHLILPPVSIVLREIKLFGVEEVSDTYQGIIGYECVAMRIHSQQHGALLCCFPPHIPHVLLYNNSSKEQCTSKCKDIA